MAGRLGGDWQAQFVTAGQHHGLHRTRQQLRQRKNHHLLGSGMLGREGLRFQRLIHPAGEFVQFHHGELVGKFLLGAFVQAQHVEHALARFVAHQAVPLAGAAQGGAQVGQPHAQRTGAKQRGAQGVDLHGQRLGASEHRQRLGRQIAPDAHARFAQLAFGGRQRAWRKSWGVFQPVEHRVGRYIPDQGTQQAHQRGGSAGGGELPAGFVAHRNAALGQHGADAAGQLAVLRNQRDRAAPGGQMGQHAGGGAGGFVFGVFGGVQRGHRRVGQREFMQRRAQGD